MRSTHPSFRSRRFSAAGGWPTSRPNAFHWAPVDSWSPAGRRISQWNAPKISSKSDHPVWNYDVIAIFTMAAGSHYWIFSRVTDVSVDHPRGSNVGIRFVFKFRLDWIFSCFADIAIFMLWSRFWLEIAYRYLRGYICRACAESGINLLPRSKLNI